MKQRLREQLESERDKVGKKFPDEGLVDGFATKL